MMGSKNQKKPARMSYAATPADGGGESFLFSGEGFGEPAQAPAAKPRPAKKPVEAGQRPAETGQRPRSPGATSGDAPRKAAPKKRPPEAAGDAPRPKPKPRPTE
jgi:hypothetical protein